MFCLISNRAARSSTQVIYNQSIPRCGGGGSLNGRAIRPYCRRDEIFHLSALQGQRGEPVNDTRDKMDKIARILSKNPELIGDSDISPKEKVPEGVIGALEWAKHCGDVGVVPPLPKDLMDALKDRTFLENNVVVYRPATIDGEPATVNLMEKLANAPKSMQNGREYYPGCPVTRIRVTQSADQRIALNKVSVKGGYWMAMTKEPLEDTFGLTYARQQRYVQKHCPGYEVPLVIDAVVAVFMHYVCSGGERLLKKQFTHCQESMKVQGWGNKDKQVCVGDFQGWGLRVSYSLEADRDCTSITPVRKFY